MRSAVLLLFAAITTLSTVAEAASWRAFRALKLYVADQPVENASVFSSRGHFIAMTPDSETAYLLAPKEFSVYRVDAATLALADGVPTVDAADKSALGDPLVLEKDGAVMNWEDGGTRYRLSAKPPLVGAITYAELAKHTKKYESAIEAYEPNATALQTFRSIDSPTEFVVAFGTWCPVCAEWLPNFVKTVQEAANDNITVRYLSINEELSQPADLMETYGIDGVPTFVVRRGDSELGRVTGERLEEEASPVLEKWLADILVSN